MKEALQNIRQSADALIAQAADAAAVDELRVRFRPHHFPSTEPSAEMDMS